VASIEFDRVSKRFSADVLAVDDLTLDVAEGEFLILVGPSGCGKTTALRMVAGLEEITSGEVRIGGRRVNELPPTQRDIAMVFQNYALYPHMTVGENIAFPLRQQKVKRAELRARVDETARLLDIEELLGRRPRELSGGQRQRVAIGRALVRRPQVFLMDEPLSNLDAKLRVQMRAELIALHQRVGITTVYVTHDQTEAMTLGDRVVVLDRGVVQQVDPPDRLYQQPANTFVAGFIGSPAMNFFEGELRDGRLRLGPHEVDVPDSVRARLTRQTGPVIAGLRPEDILLAGDRNGTFDGHVEISEHLGPEVLVHLRADDLPLARIGRRAAEDEARATRAQIVARFPAAFSAQPGERVRLDVDQERLQLFDPELGGSLLRR
jgi:multiple sugar transport system ATP-binding protein